MVAVNTPAVSNDTLIANAANGDIAARQLLAARLRKLRWMGSKVEAKLLAAKVGAGLSKSGDFSEIAQETD